MMAERGLSVDHSTIARWVLYYAPILNRRIRREVRQPNCPWRVDETYVRVAGNWTYLYRAIDSAGDTIDFLLSPNGDPDWGQRLSSTGAECRAGPSARHQCGRQPAYASAIGALNQEGERGRNCRRCWPAPYLNSLIEQDHRFVKKRRIASQGGSVR
jgi:transposase-like protein